jgi:glycine C-acetyltransferase
MNKNNYYAVLSDEVSRLDSLGITKRREKIISGFTPGVHPKVIIGGEKYLVFNSNDYLGLRFHPALLEAEHQASQKYGVGPGAVRFISGTLQIHRDLEKALADFHKKEDAVIFSSAFAANLAVISSLLKGQSKDSLLDADTLVLSDELNHRSIVDGIRVANLPPENRKIYKHLDSEDLDRVLAESAGKFTRCLVITDGVFSMLGELAPLKKIRQVIDQHDRDFRQGILLYVDDCHGIGVLGEKGRGVEETSGVQSDVLVGTLGKSFGADGGYVVGDRVVMDYLRESAATYIYSNPIPSGTAGAALAALKILASAEGQKIISQVKDNIGVFKDLMSKTSAQFAADSHHPIQPLLIGDPVKSQKLQAHLFSSGILTSGISYPIVPKGRDEIRIQLSALHTAKDLAQFAAAYAAFLG